MEAPVTAVSAERRHDDVIRASLVSFCVLATVLGPSRASRPAPDPIEMTVTIQHSRFVPDVIHAPANAAVRFTVVNNDPIAHEFLLGDKSRQAQHEAGTEAAHGDRPGELTLPPYTTASTIYRFRGAGGRIHLGCHVPGHWDYGMRATVLVGEPNLRQ